MYFHLLLYLSGNACELYLVALYGINRIHAEQCCVRIAHIIMKMIFLKSSKNSCTFLAWTTQAFEPNLTAVADKLEIVVKII